MTLTPLAAAELFNKVGEGRVGERESGTERERVGERERKRGREAEMGRDGERQGETGRGREREQANLKYEPC